MSSQPNEQEYDEFLFDVADLLNIFIEGGYAEDGDEPLLDRIHNYLLEHKKP